MTVPSGNGEHRGPESAGSAGRPLSSRPARAAANNARNKGFLGSGDPKEQAGFGKENMQHSAEFLSNETAYPSEKFHGTDSGPPDLSSLGDGGQTFGGS